VNRETRKLVGIVTGRDIAVYVVTNDRPDDDLQKALDAMESYQVRRIPVVDEDDRLVGIIAQADVATRTRATEKKAGMVELIFETSPPPAA
jgi:CBS domain-containing protein